MGNVMAKKDEIINDDTDKTVSSSSVSKKETSPAGSTVAKGRTVRHNGTTYKEGSVIPNLADADKDRLTKSGAIE